jgi:ferritin-like metal-binding protein YciE
LLALRKVPGPARSVVWNTAEASAKGRVMAKTGALQLFIDELRNACSTAHQLGRAYPRLVRGSGAVSEFEPHLEETKGHVGRLEQVFETLGERARGEHSETMASLVDEGRAILRRDLDESTSDPACVRESQPVEHHEAAEHMLLALARITELTEAADVLEATPDEEKLSLARGA